MFVIVTCLPAEILIFTNISITRRGGGAAGSDNHPVLFGRTAFSLNITVAFQTFTATLCRYVFYRIDTFMVRTFGLITIGPNIGVCGTMTVFGTLITGTFITIAVIAAPTQLAGGRFGLVY